MTDQRETAILEAVAILGLTEAAAGRLFDAFFPVLVDAVREAQKPESRTVIRDVTGRVVRVIKDAG